MVDHASCDEIFMKCHGITYRIFNFGLCTITSTIVELLNATGLRVSHARLKVDRTINSNSHSAGLLQIRARISLHSKNIQCGY